MTRLTARRLPVHQGPAAWNAILPDQPPPDPLAKDTAADLVIVGAGFAGLSAALRFHQLEPTSRITVLDAGRLAEGAAGRNSGFMIDLPHDLTSDDYAGSGDDREMIVLNRKAIAFAQDAVDQFAIDPNFFDPVGKVNGAAGAQAQAHNESYARHLAHLGERCEMLDAQQMQDLTGSGHYAGGLYTPGTVMLQPAGYIRGLGDGLRDLGVRLYENSPVTGITKAKGGAWQVETPAASVTADRVILTVNGHLESFGFERGRLMQLFLFATMTAELDANAQKVLGGQTRWGVTPSDPMGTTLRRIDSTQGGHRIVTRTCAVLSPGMRPSSRDLDRAISVMRRKFDQRFPALRGYPMEYQWSGHLCLSRNGVSVMRELEPGLFAGCVQNGLGTARGTLTGIGAAELAHGTESDVTRHFGEQPRPSLLPPRPVRETAANAFLRWKEWQARDD
ncbi:MAG: FAD-binding oxidoreductase [Pseudomonadota bacterium]